MKSEVPGGVVALLCFTAMQNKKSRPHSKDASLRSVQYGCWQCFSPLDDRQVRIIRRLELLKAVTQGDAMYERIYILQVTQP